MDEKYFIQKGSFVYMLVKSENSNPDWTNKPFEVVEKVKLDDVQRQLEISNQQLILGGLLNNDLQKEVDKLEKENTELKTKLEYCVDMSVANSLNEQLEEKQNILDEQLEIIKALSKIKYYEACGGLMVQDRTQPVPLIKKAREYLQRMESKK